MRPALIADTSRDVRGVSPVLEVVTSRSLITELATGQLNGHDTLVIELVEADETPAVIIRWPAEPSGLHPRRFPGAAEIATRTFAAAVRLTQLKPEREI